MTFSGLGRGLPEREVTNDELSRTLDTSDEWIRSRTGICSRRILDSDKALSHLAIEAGQQALSRSGQSPEAIDLVLVATVTPDTFMPATACRVAAALGCHRAGAFDLNIACSGYLYGILTAVSQMESGQIKQALVIGGDTISRIINWQDRRTAVLFGDAAGATVLSQNGNGKLLGYDFGADGSAGHELKILAGPSSPSDEVVDYQVTMNGRAVFRFAANILVKSSERTLEKAGLTLEDVDLIIPHQANLRILEFAAKKMNCSLDKFFLNVNKYGNTSAGSIPVALTEAQEAGLIHPGSKILLAGFGGGLSWGSLLLQWP